MTTKRYNPINKSEMRGAVKWKKINSFVYGITSIFGTTPLNVDDILDKYPNTYNKDVKEELLKNWNIVGRAINGAVDTYEKREE